MSVMKPERTSVYGAYSSYSPGWILSEWMNTEDAMEEKRATAVTETVVNFIVALEKL